MAGSGTRYHKCGHAVWFYHKSINRRWVPAFASLEGHRAITHCPQCGEELREGDVASEKPRGMR